MRGGAVLEVAHRCESTVVVDEASAMELQAECGLGSAM